MKKQNKAIEDLINIVKELREKCPWDKKQTIKSLRQLTVEEVFELSDSIIQSDYKNIEEEVGDLLLHVVFYCQIGKEKGKFNLESVINNLIRISIESEIVETLLFGSLTDFIINLILYIIRHLQK